jgi:hypothetical protein
MLAASELDMLEKITRRSCSSSKMLLFRWASIHPWVGREFFFPNQYIYGGILDSSDWLFTTSSVILRCARVFTMCYMIRRVMA